MESKRKLAYDTRYENQAQQVKNREERNRARAAAKKKNPGLPKTQEVDHKRPLSRGGSNAPANLRVVSRKTNRKKAASYDYGDGLALDGG